MAEKEILTRNPNSNSGIQHGIFIVRKRDPKTNRSYKRNCSNKAGKIVRNHFTMNPEARKKLSDVSKENFRRRDPFYMVDGIEVEEEFIDFIRTDSGVVTEAELQYL